MEQAKTMGAWLNPKARARPPKGTNGRYNSPPDGDCFRDLITRRESAGFTEKTILALREPEDMELSRAHGRGEDGQARAVPLNLSRSGSHPSTDRPRAING
jgi:hypothetical protein